MKEKIRVAHIVNYLSPAGKELGIVKLLNGMDSDRFKGYLIAIDEVFDSLSLDTEKTELISMGKGRGNDFKMPKKLAKVLKEKQIDIVHTHSWGTLVEGVVGSKIAGSKIVIHGEHGTFHTGLKRKIIQQILFRMADYRLSVSQVLANKLEAAFGLKKGAYDVILNGVDSEKFNFDPAKRASYRKELGVEDNTLLIGTVGRTMKIKNHPLLVKAAKELAGRGLNFKMVIIGDSPLHSTREELQKMAVDFGVSDKVAFVGARKDIPGYMSAMDIFTLPSFSEGCSNVILEAMSVGLPIVASNVGGNPELVFHKQNGLLFESDNVHAISDSFSMLLNDADLRTSFSETSRRFILERFSLQQMITNYEDYYLMTLGQKR